MTNNLLGHDNSDDTDTLDLLPVLEGDTPVVASVATPVAVTAAAAAAIAAAVFVVATKDFPDPIKNEEDALMDCLLFRIIRPKKLLFVLLMAAYTLSLSTPLLLLLWKLL